MGYEYGSGLGLGLGLGCNPNPNSNPDLVVEAAEHLDAVALVVGVAVGELLEVADLLLTRTAHHLVVALHLRHDNNR